MAMLLSISDVDDNVGIEFGMKKNMPEERIYINTYSVVFFFSDKHSLFLFNYFIKI